MVEISEKELARRREARAARPTNETRAQSFRLGEEHVEKLKKLAQRSDVSQADLIRAMIDKEWSRINKLRKQRQVTA